MRILLLGHSGSTANAARLQASSWSDLVTAELPPILGEPVELEPRRFAPHHGDTAAYIGKLLDTVKPDLVMMQVGSAPYAVPWVQVRVRQRWGDAVAARYLWAERKFDHWSRRLGPAGRWSNRRARWLAHHTIGSAPLASEEDAIAGCTAGIRRLAREENLQAVIVGCTHHATWIQRQFPSGVVKARRLNHVLEQAARDHHFAFVDSEAALSRAPDRDAAFGPDGMYRTPVGDRILADAVLEAFRSGAYRTAPAVDDGSRLAASP